MTEIINLITKASDGKALLICAAIAVIVWAIVYGITEIIESITKMFRK